jgi:hypothetical protein
MKSIPIYRQSFIDKINAIYIKLREESMEQYVDSISVPAIEFGRFELYVESAFSFQPSAHKERADCTIMGYKIVLNSSIDVYMVNFKPKYSYEAMTFLEKL